MIRETGEKDWTELLAVSDNTFVIKGAADQIVFVKGKGKKFSQMIVRGLGGQDIMSRRTK